MKFALPTGRGILAVIALVGLTACVGYPDENGILDPYEPVNRQVHEINKALDSGIVRPLSEQTAAMPTELTRPFVNFADNVGLPGKALNGLLQGNVPILATNTMRFIINSTVGIGGLLDPAGAIGITEMDTDFGATLSVWGVGEGAYVELPFYGPSTERDALGRVVDFLIDPLDRVGLDVQIDYGTYVRVAGQVIERGEIGGTIDSVLYDSADSYAQARLIYLQNRRFELGETGEATGDADFVDPFEDF
ncbi:MlaA family lipoprotein [Flavimaricola marinus]|uniref:Putative phospholipid-binding lipoprotein MlaA n=1 Tax=Flavimaricola marinus TaxID=1819565 RepID=A0A238LFE3_9RHOB|nr:VacJ family lipoprotein [Flavimaricola marinus]SMY08399.1 putative phospholipid-binding lipoprotein MlaA precursor [Flavimaricola marinus]